MEERDEKNGREEKRTEVEKKKKREMKGETRVLKGLKSVET